MSNIYSEIIISILLFLFLQLFFRKIAISRNLRIFFNVMYFILLLIVLFSTNGAIYFTDGLDYLENANLVLDKNNNQISAFMDIKGFISIGDSWHFIPNYEFALSIFFFGSTKCISIFHIFLMQISIGIWYTTFIKLFDKKISQIFVVFMLSSMFLITFTVSALKDPIVFFLVTCISSILFLINSKNMVKYITIILILLMILFFTRIYAAVAMFIATIFMIYQKVSLTKRQILICASIILTTFLILLLIPITNELISYLFSKTWEMVTKQDLSNFFVLFIIKLFNFYFSPFIFNVFSAQQLYYGCYIESFVRLLLVPMFIVGFKKICSHNLRKEIVTILFVPIVINVFALTLGEQSSPIRQFMWNYQTIVLIISIGMNEMIFKFYKRRTSNEKCLRCNHS